ncbi:MAG: hypothetical protein PHT36_01140, partial [Patescibacteria group bacterium]|nr:hypothetical protein [Patescibacteria group bacterium]
IIMGSINVAQKLSLKNTNEKIDQTKEEATEYEDLKQSVLSLESGLSGIKKILNGQNTWSKIFPHLEAATPQDIQFKSIQIEGNQITATIDGRNINSLSRFIESYKTYRVIKISGTGEPFSEVDIKNNGETVGKARVNPSGSWLFSTRINPKSDQKITILAGSEELMIDYFAETGEVKSYDAKTSAEIVNLFENINTPQYSKEGTKFSSGITFNFKREALW